MPFDRPPDDLQVTTDLGWVRIRIGAYSPVRTPPRVGWLPVVFGAAVVGATRLPLHAGLVGLAVVGALLGVGLVRSFGSTGRDAWSELVIGSEDLRFEARRVLLRDLGEVKVARAENGRPHLVAAVDGADALEIPMERHASHTARWLADELVALAALAVQAR